MTNAKMRLESSNKAIKCVIKVHKPFVVFIYMIVCTDVPPWIVLDLLQWKTQCLFTYIRSGSVGHYFPVESQKLCFSRTGFVYVKIERIAKTAQYHNYVSFL
jgi:hypothetical protein